MLSQGEALQRTWNAGITTQGRVCRSQFWWSMLVIWFLNCLVPLVLRKVFLYLEYISAPGAFEFIAAIVGLLFGIAIACTSISLGVRRFHDLNRSGLWMVFYFIPLLNIIPFIFWLFRGTIGPNRFGTDPLAPPPDSGFQFSWDCQAQAGSCQQNCGQQSCQNQPGEWQNHNQQNRI